MHGIDFLYRYLTRRLVSEFALQESDSNDACNCCGRASSDWLEPDKKTVGSYSGQIEIHCLSCQCLYHGSFDKIGHEGFRGSSPVAMKLGMLKGCGLLLTTEKSILYAPGKYFQKFKEAKDSIFDEIIDLGGKRVILDVLDRKPAPPYLFISNFGVKKKELVQNLKVTDTLRNLLVCSDAECIEIPFAFLEFQKSLSQAAAKDSKAWLELFKRSCSNYLTVDEVAKLNDITVKYPGISLAVRKLPEDPHLRYKCALLAEESI